MHIQSEQTLIRLFPCWVFFLLSFFFYSDKYLVNSCPKRQREKKKEREKRKIEAKLRAYLEDTAIMAMFSIVMKGFTYLEIIHFAGWCGACL